MALTIQITARKLLQRTQLATNAALNAIGLPTFSIAGTLETAQIADNAVTAAKAQYGAWHWAGASTAANVITLTTGNSLSGTPATGEVVAFKCDAANTDAVDVIVDSYAPTNLKRKSGLELVQDDLATGQIVEIRFDGTDWQLLTPVNNQELIVGEDAGSDDAYAFTASPTLVAYRTGLAVIFKANTKNSGPASLNLSTIGEVTIKKQKDQDLGSGDLKAGQWVKVIHDGTNFQLVSPVAQVDAPAVPAISHDLTVVKGSTAASEIDVDADFLMLSNAAGAQKLLTGVNLTLDMTTVEAQDGLDDGTETADTWYYVYVCYDQATDATFGLFSTSASAPSTDHVAYTHYAQVGVVRNDSSSDFAQFAVRKGDRWLMETAEIDLAEKDLQSNGTTNDVAHPFARVPQTLRLVVVCKTTELGFAQDDEVDGAGLEYWDTARYLTAVAVYGNSSQVSVTQVGSASAYYLRKLSATIGTITAITNANWKLKLYAEF